jgi:ABC-type Co2+ transport system permease subunit
MDNQTKASHITAGLIIAGILIVYSMVLTFSGQSTNQSLGMLSLLILVAGLIFFIMQYGKSVDHTATFGQLFNWGFKATAVATIIVLASQVIFFLIFPEYRDKMEEISREQMYKQGLSDAQVEQAIGMTKRFFWPFLIGGTIVSNLLVGLIASLIGAAITKKTPQSPFQQS